MQTLSNTSAIKLTKAGLTYKYRTFVLDKAKCICTASYTKTPDKNHETHLKEPLTGSSCSLIALLKRESHHLELIKLTQLHIKSQTDTS